MGKSKFELKTPKGTKDCKGPNYPSPAITTLFATDDHHKRLRIDQNNPSVYNTPPPFLSVPRD